MWKLINWFIYGPKKIGQVTEVKNTEKYKTANAKYFHVKVIHDGVERDWMLTPHEMGRAADRAVKNEEDLPVK